MTLTTAGFGVEEISGSTSGLKELVRFKIISPVVSVLIDATTWEISRWVYCRILAPIYFNKA